jgi:uncharacterized protein YcbK (DUF882 family)
VRVVCLALAALISLPASGAIKKPQEPPAPAAVLFSLNARETYKLKPNKKGRFDLKGWARFLRCHHTGRRHAMSPRLANLLYDVAKHFDWKRIEIVAGYRAPRVAKQKGNPKSPHKQGSAIDLRVAGISSTELRDYVRTAFDRVGIGWYPNSDFVHLDVRKKGNAFWIDYSGPGERAKYSKNPSQDLMDEAAANVSPVPGEGAAEPEIPGSPGVVTPTSPALEPVTP